MVQSHGNELECSPYPNTSERRNHQIIAEIAKLTLDPSGSMIEICVIISVIKNMYNGWQWEKNNEQLAQKNPNTNTIY